MELLIWLSWQASLDRGACTHSHIFMQSFKHANEILTVSYYIFDTSHQCTSTFDYVNNFGSRTRRHSGQVRTKVHNLTFRTNAVVIESREAILVTHKQRQSFIHRRELLRLSVSLAKLRYCVKMVYDTWYKFSAWRSSITDDRQATNRWLANLVSKVTLLKLLESSTRTDNNRRWG